MIFEELSDEFEELDSGNYVDEGVVEDGDFDDAIEDESVSDADDTVYVDEAGEAKTDDAYSDEVDAASRSIDSVEDDYVDDNTDDYATEDGETEETSEDITFQDDEYLDGEVVSDDEEFLDVASEQDRDIASEDEEYFDVASGVDAPDVNLEAYLDRVFNQYSDRLDQSRWSEMIGKDGVSEVYSIQPGDTLWDISSTLFGSGYFWPKIWQVNSVLLNPHFILSGGEIRFTPGSSSNAPRLDLVTEDEVGADSSGLFTSASIPDLPPAKETRYSSLPPSLPGMNLNLPKFERVPYSGVTVDDFRDVFGTEIPIRSYLTERRPSSYGRVVDIEEWDSVATHKQHVYIEGRGLSVDESYLVFNDDESISHPTRVTSAGYLVSIQGIVKVLEHVDPKKNLYRAIVEHASNPIYVGSNIGTLDDSLRYNLLSTDQLSGIRATVVSGFEGNARLFVGMSELLFLDKGQNDGVRVGDMMSVIKKDSGQNRSKQTVGTIKVVKTTPARSTAVVLSARDIISPGDYTQRPN